MLSNYDRELSSYNKIDDFIRSLMNSLNNYLEREGSISRYAKLQINGEILSLGEALVYLDMLNSRATSTSDIVRYTRLKRKVDEAIKLIKTKLLKACQFDNDLMDVRRCLDLLILELRYSLDLEAIKSSNINAYNVNEISYETLEELSLNINKRKSEIEIKSSRSRFKF